jgi:hypothetical protein
MRFEDITLAGIRRASRVSGVFADLKVPKKNPVTLRVIPKAKIVYSHGFADYTVRELALYNIGRFPLGY